jgi:hypothetical protein
MRAIRDPGVAFGAGIALWMAANLTDDVREPWDGASFGLFYAAALAVSAILGAFAQGRAWAVGAAVVWAMLPVMVIASGAGPLIALGVIILAAMSLPAAGVAELAFRLRRRATAR